jgi:hypothetical protein
MLIVGILIFFLMTIAILLQCIGRPTENVKVPITLSLLGMLLVYMGVSLTYLFGMGSIDADTYRFFFAFIRAMGFVVYGGGFLLSIGLLWYAWVSIVHIIKYRDRIHFKR